MYDYKALMLIICLTTLLGQVSIHPFNTAFRFGLGPLIFAFLILLNRKKLHPALTGVLTGVFVLLFRSTINLFQGVVLQTALNIHFPAMVYYIAMGLGFRLINISRFNNKPFVLGNLLTIVDFTSNVIEIFIRIITGEEVSFFALNLAMVAVIRMFIASGIFTMLNYQKLQIIHSIEKKNYENLLIKTSNLYSEIFFLETTSSLIEEIMAKSYSLYKTLSRQKSAEAKKFSKDLLNIATDIHEIKKHYNRIAAGLKKLLDEDNLDEAINTFKQVVQVLLEANKDYSKNLKKEIQFDAEVEYDFVLKDLFAIVSILNNLVSNAIDAIQKEGWVKIHEWEAGDNVIIEVKDSGMGIPDGNIDYIFEAGFTTKYDPSTGKSSTGIGLVHVKSLVKQLGGEIKVRSKVGEGAVFRMVIPKTSVVKP